MDVRTLAETLHPLERKVLPLLEKHAAAPEIAQLARMQEVEVVRAFQWLSNKGAAALSADEQELIDLGANGQEYRTAGLPERRALQALAKAPVRLNDLPAAAGITGEELTFCLGALRGRKAMTLEGGRAAITPNGISLLKQEWPEEEFLKLQFPLAKAGLKPAQAAVLDALRKRKDIVRLSLQKVQRAKLTDLGKVLVKEAAATAGFLEKLTPELLRSGAWKGKPLRRFDVTINVPRVHAGRKQPYRAFLDQVRQRFLALGFTEMAGPVVESDFWDMDALFMPQFHSARDLHQAYYVKEPQEAQDIPPAILKKVKQAHEEGIAGSTGWQYAFDAQRTKRQMLRTQCTACSARMLASPGLQVPGKYFGISRCFRYDKIDATHLPDFNQIEGIVLEEGLNLRHLFGLLKMIAKEFAGAEHVRLVPSYFPFTEPSAELFAKHPQLGWVELGGAGILRPEVVVPLTGRDIPVIAWGLGIDRLAMFRLGIKDIRQLYSHDLGWLRTARLP
jgi:phenylalanyl-tRNA synthetase alpha chain